MKEPKRNFLLPTNMRSPAAIRFWEGLQQGKFLAPRCIACGSLFFPPRLLCPGCLGENFQWEELSGKGYLYSWTELFYAQPVFDTPFLLGLIDLEEGIGRIAAKISGARAKELYIGMPMRIRFTAPYDGFSLYYMEPFPPER